MTPFERFFDAEFQRRLDAAPQELGSWDRKAAWLLWCAEGRQPVTPSPDIDPLADLIG